LFLKVVLVRGLLSLSDVVNLPLIYYRVTTMRRLAYSCVCSTALK
jgi:hypothetical protein